MTVASWRSGALVLAAALVPVLAAVWGIRWFVTQDGPAHLYNAHIIASSLGPDSPFAAYYAVRWEALPNWGGHLVTALLVEAMGDRPGPLQNVEQVQHPHRLGDKRLPGIP